MAATGAGLRRICALLALAGAAACSEPNELIRVSAVAYVAGGPVDFGEVPVGEAREVLVEVHNPGRVPFALRSLKEHGNPSFIVVNEDDVVPSFSSRKVWLRFRPLDEGVHQDEVRIDTDGAVEDRLLPVKGTGVPAPIVIDPPVLDFQTLEVDSDRVLEVTVTNPVGLPAELTFSGDGASQFSREVAEVPAYSTVKVPIRFHPDALGPQQARLEARVCARCTPATNESRGNSVPHAFLFNPTPVPFEPVPVHAHSPSYVELTNITWRPVTVGELLPSDQAFAALTTLRGLRLAPGETTRIDLQFSARQHGPAVGTLDVHYQSDRARRAQVTLDARGGRPQLALTPITVDFGELALTPITVDFGELPVGGKAEQVVRLSNAGSTGALHFAGVRATGAIAQFGVSRPIRAGREEAWSAGSAWPELAANDLPIQPGADHLDLKVYFQPTAEGAFEATLVVRTDDMFQPEQTVRLTGRSRPSGPCSWRLLPANGLEFGNVPAGTGAVLGFRFENAGTLECAVKDIHLSDDAGGAFYMPGGALTGGNIRSNDGFSAMIAFRTATPGRYTGTLQLTVNDPANPVITLPLSAVAEPSCLRATPNFLDFGPVRYDCAPEPRLTRVTNRCPSPVIVSRIEVGPGTSRQFSLSQRPALPLLLQPGESFEVEATYARNVHGQHYSPLWIHASSDPAPFLVPMLAETNHEGTTSERFIQATADRLDVLFVVSNTSTMGTFHKRLQDAMPGWIALAESLGLDLQVGVTSTGLVPRNGHGSLTCGGGAGGGEAGRLFPVDGSRPRIVRGRTSQVSALQQNLAVGECHNLVQGLEAARLALSPPLVDRADDARTPEPNDGNLGFLRAAARLAVIFVSDDDDYSGFETAGYAQFLQELKGPGMSHRVQAHALVPDGSCRTVSERAERFAEVARRTGGEVASICGGYDGLLERIARQASGPQAEFPLSWPVDDPASVTVRVNGVTVPNTQWRIDVARNALVFEPTAVPTPGQRIDVRYRSVCGTVPN